MDAANDLDTNLGEPIDACLVQIWPAPAAPRS
jgi:hypothetical protein